jgi:hypothetical protein
MGEKRLIPCCIGLANGKDPFAQMRLNKSIFEWERKYDQD